MIVRTASGLVECTAFMRTSGGLVECGDAKFRGSAGLTSIASVKPMAVSASPDSVYGATSGSLAPIRTNSATATVSGGKAPYTYTWQKITSDSLVATAPASASSAFSSSVPPGEDRSDTFVCIVTDAAGRTATSNEVYATVSNYGGGGNAQL